MNSYVRKFVYIRELSLKKTQKMNQGSKEQQFATAFLKEIDLISKFVYKQKKTEFKG